VNDRPDLQLRYEQLRQKRLDAAGGWAMNVLVQEGMCAWIHAWTHPIAAAEREGEFHCESPSGKDPSNDKAGRAVGELVGLIASMALTKMKGV